MNQIILKYRPSIREYEIQYYSINNLLECIYYALAPSESRWLIRAAPWYDKSQIEIYDSEMMKDFSELPISWTEPVLIQNIWRAIEDNNLVDRHRDNAPMRHKVVIDDIPLLLAMKKTSSGDIIINTCYPDTGYGK